MPTAAATRCHCGTRATHQGRCPTHQRKAWANPSTNTQTLSGGARHRIRTDQLEREPQCRTCGSQQNLEADHIIELADGGAIDDPGNLQTLCQDCHETKTRQARAARQRR